MIRYSLLLIVLLILISCSSEHGEKNSNPEVTEENHSMNDTTGIEIPHDSTATFHLASDGFEYKVIQHYVEKYKTNNLRSVHNGIPKVMDTTKHEVYLDSRLRNYKNLNFFNGKYPEFLERTSTPAKQEDGKDFEEVNCPEFKELSANDFLKNKDQYNSRDLLLVVSKAHFHDGAYYVHVWQISNDKVIHQREATYKFDGTGDFINQSYKNYYQLGYDGIDAFLNRIDKD